MDYNPKDYEIVQLGSNEWGIQYRNGPLIRDFTTAEQATASAITNITDNQLPSNRSASPRNLSEATAFAAHARESYRKFIGENPSATTEQKEVKAAEIQAADAYVSEYLAQQETARARSSAKNSFEALNQQQTLASADTQRTIAKQNAIAVRADPASTNQQIVEADSQAFQAEIYYENLRQEQQQDIERVNPTSFGLNSLFSNVTSVIDTVTEPFSSGLSGITNTATSFLDGIGDDLSEFSNNLFGGLNGIGSFGGNASSNTSSSGNSLYNSSTGSSVTSQPSDQRVRLSPKPSVREKMLSGVLSPLKDAGGLIFPFTPQIAWQSDVNYNVLKTVHANNDWHIYSNTPSVQLIITGTFTAQNQTEAEYLLASIHFLRVLTKMHFGSSEENKGLPPPQVILDGYGTHMFNGLSVIVKAYEIQMPNNVDYVEVQSGGGVSKVPVVTDLTVTCTVQQTPKKSREFNWDSFASGELMQRKGWI